MITSASPLRVRERATSISSLVGKPETTMKLFSFLSLLLIPGGDSFGESYGGDATAYRRFQ